MKTLAVGLNVALAVLYILTVERLVSQTALVHLFAIPFGNIWIGAAFFSIGGWLVAVAAKRLVIGASARRIATVLVGLMTAAWSIYIALGFAMYMTGGI
jgi:hypothetical protein